MAFLNHDRPLKYFKVNIQRSFQPNYSKGFPFLPACQLSFLVRQYDTTQYISPSSDPKAVADCRVGLGQPGVTGDMDSKDGLHFDPETGVREGLPCEGVIIPSNLEADPNSCYDAIVIGAGYAGLVAARDLAIRGTPYHQDKYGRLYPIMLTSS